MLKRERFDSPAYRDYIAGLPCIIGVGCDGPIDPAHTVEVNKDGSDLTCIPLCRFAHHKEQEKRTALFVSKYQIDLPKLLLHLQEDFLRSVGACEGEVKIPKASRGKRVSTRKNRVKREPYKKPWQ